MTTVVKNSSEGFVLKRKNTRDSYRSVTGGAECLRHALIGPCEDVTAGSHRPSDQHRLTCELKQEDKKIDGHCVRSPAALLKPD